MRTNRSGRALVLLYALMTANVAVAQAVEPAPSTVDQTATSGRPGGNAEAAASGIDDIIVTAQRRPESLQRVAVAISAVTGGELVYAGVSDVTNLSKLVPALVVQPNGGSSTNFYLRRVGSHATNALRPPHTSGLRASFRY